MSSGGFETLPNGASSTIKPWRVDIPQESLDELNVLLKRTPLAPPTYENSLPDAEDRHLGVRRDWLTAAKKHWEDGGFDWRKKEEYINTFPHFKAQIHDDALSSDFDIHFVALFSKRSDAIPIVFVHGWPGSFLEFLPMLELLRSRYKTADELPYHLIVPSLPGYTFSSAPPLDKNFTIDDAARLFDRLIVHDLGLSAYVAQGGDVGGRVARSLASQYEHCKAAHLNTAPMPAPDPSRLQSPISALEHEGIERGNQFTQTGSAYAIEHATRPSTIGFVLSSSPVALLAWIGEKFRDWTDADPPLDTILESVALYWLTNCAATSLWSYRQVFGPDAQTHSSEKWYIGKPFGFSWFKKEISPVPKAWVELTGNLVFHRQHDKGGHFAALEHPQVLWDDVEQFLAQVRGQCGF
ncbi:hypothetical protein LTR84_000539 [Exophiala bonariae]|uniref:Epoxide hydrolase N-terminal domain-containing protein n=1 Tax=Exophiala bonariae TaxID=1690606 RepID=A0AAV9NRD6_9EURO|nr:hypothetical protein LTR84_000539 [Exophiala bonariae]